MQVKAHTVYQLMCASSQLSAYSIISVPAEIYSFGSHYPVVVVPVVVAMTLMVSYGILPVFYHNRIDNCYGVCSTRGVPIEHTFN